MKKTMRVSAQNSQTKWSLARRFYGSKIRTVGLPRSTPSHKSNRLSIAAKESHKVQKELYAQRKAAKPNAGIIEQAKRVWAGARKLNISKEEREKYIKQLLDIVRGKVQEVVFKHDASRIIQTVRGIRSSDKWEWYIDTNRLFGAQLVKYGGQTERDLVASELQGKFKELVQNKYSKVLQASFSSHSSSCISPTD